MGRELHDNMEQAYAKAYSYFLRRSTEHGIGISQGSYFLRRPRRRIFSVMNTIKTALDPKHTLNDQKPYYVENKFMQSLSERTASLPIRSSRRMTRVSMQWRCGKSVAGFRPLFRRRSSLDRLAQVAYEDYHQYSITRGCRTSVQALAAKQTYRGPQDRPE